MKFKKPLNYYIRALHRDIGFFVIALTIIYCLSGITLIFRGTDYLKQEKDLVRRLPHHIQEEKLGRILRIKNFKITKTEGDIVYFTTGTYNRETGIAAYRGKALPEMLEKFNRLHRLSSGNAFFWFSLVYGILLLFLALSSFWMYKPGSRLFRRGIFITVAGLIASIIILFII